MYSTNCRDSLIYAEFCIFVKENISLALSNFFKFIYSKQTNYKHSLIFGLIISFEKR